VYKYLLHYAVDGFFQTWLSAQNPHFSLQKTYTVGELKYWLCITWVARRPIYFRHFSLQLIRLSTRKVKIPGLPVPLTVTGRCVLVMIKDQADSCTEDITAQRLQVIKDMRAAITRVKDKYEDGIFTPFWLKNPGQCTVGCDMMHLGAISMISKRVFKCVYVNDVWDLKDISASEVMRMVKEFEVPSFHHEFEERPNPFQCQAINLVEAVCDVYLARKGLELKNYVNPRER
jgi:hypothetical protein